MRSLEGILAQHPFFSGWEPRYFQLAVGCASNVRFNAGELLCHEGREANTFYLIRAGKVALEVYFPGRGSVPMETVGTGEMLGWSWLIPPYRWGFDARPGDRVRWQVLAWKMRRGSRNGLRLGETGCVLAGATPRRDPISAPGYVQRHLTATALLS
jgi:CRP/FNR family transcriptional regulator, cyclic AMP receptor protein